MHLNSGRTTDCREATVASDDERSAERERLAVMQLRANSDHPVCIEWVDEAVLDADPGLVRTMSVAPPRGTGRLRLMRIGEADALVDLQPCGGMHVARTGEIGRISVVKIENKGRQNRRIIIAPAG